VYLLDALSQSLQHINTRRICVSDDSGAETCITKAQLDAVLVSQSHMEASHPAEIIDAAKVPAEPAAVRASQKDRGPWRSIAGSTIVRASAKTLASDQAASPTKCKRLMLRPNSCRRRHRRHRLHALTLARHHRAIVPKRSRPVRMTDHLHTLLDLSHKSRFSVLRCSDTHLSFLC
jgi:hypothetical protein